MRRAVPFGLLVVLVGGAARADTRAFAETYETRTGAEGDAQVETWIDDDLSFENWAVWRLWWGGTASISDSVEISAYVVAAQQEVSGGGEGSGLQLEMLYLMGRWRFLGDGVHGFSLMGQLELCVPALWSSEDQSQYKLLSHALVVGQRLVAAYNAPHFIVAANALLDEPFLFTGGPFKAGFKWTAGAAWAPWAAGQRGAPFTLGLEAFGDAPIGQYGDPGIWAVWWPGGFPDALGPAISFASGRFWATASWGFAPTGVVVEPATPAYGRGFATWEGREGVGRLIVAFEF